MVLAQKNGKIQISNRAEFWDIINGWRQPKPLLNVIPDLRVVVNTE